jgi:hypothetical protein
LKTFFVRSGAVLIAAGTLFATHSDLVGTYLLGSSDTRLYLKKEKQQRSETIALQNRGSERSEPVVVHVNLPSRNIVDFEWSIAPEAPRVSFLNSVKLVDSIRKIANRQPRSLLRNMDEHSPPNSLYGLEEALGSVYVDAEKKKGRNVDPSVVLQAHIRFLPVCSGSNSTGDCQGEEDYEAWEEEMQFVKKEAEFNWEQLTGLRMNFSSGVICPNGELAFVGRLDPGAGGALKIRYGPNQTTAETQVTPIQGLNVVDSEADLRANRWLIALKYHPYKTILTAVGLILLAAVVTPRKLLPPHRIFNDAMVSCAPDGDELWELGFSKTRFMLLDSFQRFCVAFNKPRTTVPAEELFEYVKDRLRVEYGMNRTTFANGTEMNQAFRSYMRELALNA